VAPCHSCGLGRCNRDLRPDAAPTRNSPNVPDLGHFRYWLEAIGPGLRQYIVADNNEERPFSRDQRRWIYASAKRENNYFGFGSDNEMELQPNYLIIEHNTFR
jgi:hypothetical protein